MSKKTIAVIGAGAMIAAGALTPMTAASAADGNRGKLCKGNRFLVEHVGDSVNGYPVPEGYYKTFVRRLPCSSAIIDLHNWLATGETLPGWSVSKGGRGKRSIMFRETAARNTFFEIKRIKNQPN